MKKTKKAFRAYLNNLDSEKWRHNQYGQRKRPYGDYLYNQDRIKFDLNYAEWLEGDNE